MCACAFRGYTDVDPDAATQVTQPMACQTCKPSMQGLGRDLREETDEPWPAVVPVPRCAQMCAVLTWQRLR